MNMDILSRFLISEPNPNPNPNIFGKMLPTTPSVVKHIVKHFVISSCVIQDL